MAILATPSNRRIFEEEEKNRLRKDRQAKEAALARAEKMKDLSCTIPVRADEEDKLYGSVTAADIAKALEAQGLEVDRKQIELEEPIKKLGVYTVELRLHREVSVPVKVWVVRE
jgi:large subunit ribosomal protein L9